LALVDNRRGGPASATATVDGLSLSLNLIQILGNILESGLEFSQAIGQRGDLDRSVGLLLFLRLLLLLRLLLTKSR
jgi:hypothetical protein